MYFVLSNNFAYITLYKILLHCMYLKIETASAYSVNEPFLVTWQMDSEKLRLSKLKNFLKELTSQRKPLCTLGYLVKMLEFLEW